MARKRDERGRFIKGGPGGPGRPPATKEIAYWDVAQSSCSLDDWRAVVTQAVADAKNGDTAARSWLTSIVVGDPLRLRARADVAACAPAGSAADVAAILAHELAAVARFPNDPRRAATVARLSDALLRAIETSDLAEMMTNIETMLKEMKQ